MVEKAKFTLTKVHHHSSKFIFSIQSRMTTEFLTYELLKNSFMCERFYFTRNIF